MLVVRRCGGKYTRINRLLPLQKLPLGSLDLDSMLDMEQEEEPPFPEAQRILQYSATALPLQVACDLQVFSHGSFAGEHPVNRKAKCKVYLRDLQKQTGLTDQALQLVARVCGSRCNLDYGLCY